jgi:cyclopropane-fatty-acyl-phospholipid synthase
MSDLGFAEAFMYGDVECDDLVTLFKVVPSTAIFSKNIQKSLSQIFLLNRENLAEMQSGVASLLFNFPQRLTSTRFLNTLSNSRSNISAHYDISNQYVVSLLAHTQPPMIASATYACYSIV